MRKLNLAAGVTLAAALTVATALPAAAADTTTTFALSGGAIAITAPASRVLDPGVAGGPAVSTQLGAVTVTDNRGLLNGAWTGSVTSTDFTTGAASAAETIGKASLSYWSGAVTAQTGTAVRTPGQLLATNAVDLSVARTPFSAAATAGNNTTAWNPTIVVTPPTQSVVGTYSGTITHSLV